MRQTSLKADMFRLNNSVCWETWGVALIEDRGTYYSEHGTCFSPVCIVSTHSTVGTFSVIKRNIIILVFSNIGGQMDCPYWGDKWAARIGEQMSYPYHAYWGANGLPLLGDK